MAALLRECCVGEKSHGPTLLDHMHKLHCVLRWFLSCPCVVFPVGSEVSYVELYDGPDGKSTGSGYVILFNLSIC